MCKSGEHLEASNYKIYVLPVFSRVVEKAVTEQMIVLLDVSSYLSSYLSNNVAETPTLHLEEQTKEKKYQRTLGTSRILQNI